MIPSKILPMLGVLVVACACGAPSGAPAPAPKVPTGLYSAPQAERGRATFRGVCAECHYSSEFRDSKFQYKWGRRTVKDLYHEIVRNMPEDDPGSLSDQEYVDIVSYILELNGFQSGDVELVADEDVLSGYSMTPPPAGGRH